MPRYLRLPALPILGAVMLLLLVPAVGQGVPTFFTYQGKLTGAGGGPVTDGTYKMVFTLFTTDIGGTAFWTSGRMDVAVANGQFTCQLTPLTPAVLAGKTDVWLQISVGEPPVILSPRVKLGVTPFALRAGDLTLPFSGSQSSTDPLLSLVNTGTGSALRAQGTVAADLQGKLLVSGNVGIGTTSPLFPLDVNGIIRSKTGGFQFPDGTVQTQAGTYGTGTTYRLARWLGNQRLGPSIIHETTFGQVGFGTDSPTAPLEIVATQSYAKLTTTTHTNGSVLILKNQQASPTTVGAINFENSANETRGQLAYLGTDAMTFRVNDTEQMRITHFGHIGIGTTTPNGKLTLVDNTGGRVLELWQLYTGLGETPVAIYNNGDTPAVAIVQSNTTTSAAALYISTKSNGLRIITPAGKVGLQVEGGSKNAVVPTSQGKRLLYSEESTEVWFTDYGFGTLHNGRVTITIDPLFAETVDLSQPYHVFLQPNDPECAGIAVTNRTATSFTAVELQHGTSNAEFSYRLVAKRKDFVGDRLAPAP